MSCEKHREAGRKAAETRRKRAGQTQTLCPTCHQATPTPISSAVTKRPRVSKAPAAPRQPDPIEQQETGIRARPLYLVPGRDHRRTPGKATFAGKGAAIVCKSTAYWKRPINAGRTVEEWQASTAFTRLLHNIAQALAPEAFKDVNKDSPFRVPTLYTREQATREHSVKRAGQAPHEWEGGLAAELCICRWFRNNYGLRLATGWFVEGSKPDEWDPDDRWHPNRWAPLAWWPEPKKERARRRRRMRKMEREAA